MKSNKFFVTGIGTDVGKTVASAILALALDADYWKPIQAGELDNSDSIKVKRLTGGKIHVFPEAYRLTSPMSPHAAAKIDEITIKAEELIVPQTDKNLIIEGAGGVFVPITDSYFFIDWLEEISYPVIIVSKHYVGSINHTLLTIEALKARNIDIKGVIFIGDENRETEAVILNNGNVDFLGRIPIVEELTQTFIEEQAALIGLKLNA